MRFLALRIFAARLRKKAKGVKGTLDYMAPEVLVAAMGYFGKPVDMWAFGAMVYEMRVGRACFVAPDVESLKLRIKNGFKGGTETNPWLPHMKPPCRKVINGLLQKDPGEEANGGADAQQQMGHRCVRAERGRGAAGHASKADPAAAAASGDERRE